MNKIYKQIAEELNLPIEVIKKSYESFFEFIRETIKNIPLKEDIDLSDYRTSFNIPSIGKLYCNEKKFKKIKECYDKSSRKN